MNLILLESITIWKNMQFQNHSVHLCSTVPFVSFSVHFPEKNFYRANPSKFERVADVIFNWKPHNEEGFPDEADTSLKTIHASILADLTLIESG